MNVKRYLLIQGDEDGNPLRWLSVREVDDIPTLMEDHGIKHFVDDVPTEQIGSLARAIDPNYWPEGQALLLEVKVVRVKPVEVVTSYAIETDDG